MQVCPVDKDGKNTCTRLLYDTLDRKDEGIYQNRGNRADIKGYQEKAINPL